MRRPTLLLFLLLLGLARGGLAEGFYADGHAVMVEALRSGQAAGVMGGALARRFAQQFDSQGALLVQARRIHSFRQSGCARLALRFSQQDVPTPQGFTVVHLDTQINYCLDGEPPRSQE